MSRFLSSECCVTAEAVLSPRRSIRKSRHTSPDLTPEEQEQYLDSSQGRKWWNLVQWVRQALVRTGEIDGSTRGVWKLTDAGRTRLTSAETQPDAQVRIQGKIEVALPDGEARCSALEFLAYAIENADDERSDGWCLKETRRGLSLHTGRLQACRIRPNRLEVSVVGPVSDDTLEALGADPAAISDFKAVPGCQILSFPSGNARVASEMLKRPFDQFVDEAMARMRTSMGTSDHEPEAVAYVARIVGRELPQPSEGVGDLDAVANDEDDGLALRDPKVRGRAPIFEHGQRTIASLISDIEEQAIALPDLQRPFVWSDTKVRDLLDSLFLGFPVGTLVLWHTSDGREARPIGEDSNTIKSTALVIDGQQRLTSLYAVLRGSEVVNKDGTKRHISIAFRPRDGRLEVADAAIRKDPEFLPNIVELWGPRSKTQIKKDLLKMLREKGRDIDDTYEDAVDENLDRARAISDYTFPVVAIRKTASAAEVSDEDVAEVFVRINSQGTRLGQVDFVLTLLSVYHGELRDRIEQRAAALTADPIAALDTRQLLRATCGVAFGRARMRAIYRYLRGMDPVSGDTSIADRQARLNKLDVAADECIHSTTWQDFTLRVVAAGFVDQTLIASTNAIVNAFTFYVLGQRHNVRKPVLDECISRWVFATLLSARYSGASETTFEEDLGRIRDLEPADGPSFVRTLDDALSETITGDYWSHTLVAALQTQRRRAPAPLAFRAAQIVLGARGLFSDQLLQNLLAPPAKGKRSASEAHHLFPVAWLARVGITDRKIANQAANYADLGYYENSMIGAQSAKGIRTPASRGTRSRR